MKSKFFLIFTLCCQFCFAQNWQTLGYGLSWNTTCMYEDTVTDQLFVGGNFGLADSQVVRFGAAYNGAWSALGMGFNVCSWGSGLGNPWAITRYGSHIYFGGNFACAGNIDNTNSFARWNGVAWDSVPGGKISYGGVLKDIIVYNNEMYICGTFDSVGNLPAKGIAKWDGTTWSVIGSNYNFTAGSSFLTKMMFYAGEFYYGGGNPGTGIMRWNDTTWRDVGGSVQMGTLNQYPVVKEMCVHNGKLYCVGNFEKIGGVDALGLASWDGNLWCGYDTHFDFSAPNEFVGAWNIAFFRDTMYVGGGFQYMDTMQVNYIARWVGGNFVDTCGTAVGVFENLMFINRILVYPNPASEIITFDFSDSPQSRSLIIYDQLGREVYREDTNENLISLSVQEFAEGIYFYSVIDEEGKSRSGRFIVAK